MALVTVNNILVENHGGAFVSIVPDVDGTYLRGDVVQLSTTNDGKVKKSDTGGSSIFGIVADEAFDSTVFNSTGSEGDIGNQKMLVWTGPGVVWVRVASTPAVGIELTSDTGTDLKATAADADTIVGVVYSATAVDTVYQQVRLN